jgi:hypothetical protein
VIRVQIDVGEQAIVLCRGVFGEHARQRSQLTDEELEVDLQLLARPGTLAPRLGLGNS